MKKTLLFLLIVGLPALAYAQVYEAVEGKVMVTATQVKSLDPDVVEAQCDSFTKLKEEAQQAKDDYLSHIDPQIESMTKREEICRTIKSSVVAFIEGDINAMEGTNWSDLDHLTKNEILKKDK